MPRPSYGTSRRARQRHGNGPAAGRRHVAAAGLPVTDPAYRRGTRPPNAGKRYPAEVLSAGEVAQLLDACPASRAYGLRNRALIVMLWRSGLRIAEALALFPKDVDLERGTITVLRGKGAKRRTVGIDPQALAVLGQWLARRFELGIGSDAPLFCVIRGPTLGRPVNSAYVRDALKDLARAAGVRKRVHPHAFRHTHAFELAMEGVPVHVIQMQLGHSSLVTTERYVRHLAPVTVIRTMQERAWPDEMAVAA